MKLRTNPVPDAPIRVVVADDHPIIRGMVRSALQQHPHFEVCGEAENGADAIEEVKRERPDVVVLNVTMPLVNGFEAAREIKNRFRKPRSSFCRHMPMHTLSPKPKKLAFELMYRNRK